MAAALYLGREEVKYHPYVECPVASLENKDMTTNQIGNVYSWHLWFHLSSSSLSSSVLFTQQKYMKFTICM